MNEEEKYLDKIKKLLNLAKRGTNEYESANAISQAQNLMTKLGLSEVDIKLMDIHEFSSNDTPSNAEKFPRYANQLANMLCRAFGVKCYYSWSGMNRRNVVFYGPYERPQIAAYGFDVLTKQLRKARTDYLASQRKTVKRTTKINRADKFCEGWVNGAWQVIASFSVREQETKLMQLYYRKIAEEHNFTDLTVRDAKKCRGEDDAYNAGYTAGEDARLHLGVNGDKNKMERIGR